MKIDRAKLKKATTEVPADCRALIDKIKSCQRNDLVTQLKQVKSWSFGKCELYHWADVLDIFDDILDAACNRGGATDGASTEHHWALSCDLDGNERDKELLLQVLQFTALLIEHSFTRHLYSSMEHLTTLLASSDMTTVLAVLNLLYVFSKRSNFITRLNAEKKQGLVMALTHLAESWGGKENGFGLAECCQDLPMNSYPPSATTLHFDFYTEVKEEKGKGKHTACVLTSIHVQNVDKIPKLPAFIMDELMQSYKIPESKQMLLFTHIRLAHSFSNYEQRIQCVQARLQAISILVYSNAIQENVNTLLYSGFTEELVDILELKTDKLMEIKAASLRTLTSVIHLERNPKLSNIIDATGAAHYHGFLPVLVRTCMQHMIDPDLPPFPQPFATALFSFLYHLASYESGGEALVSCGMMEALLKIVNWYGEGQEHITFVTRAVRVVDLITNLDMQAFQAHGGLSTFINRLEHEVDICRKEQPFVIRPPRTDSTMDIQPSSPSNPGHSPPSPPASASPSHTCDLTMDMEGSLTGVNQGASTSADPPIVYLDAPAKGPSGKPLQCFPQRAALLKSMLNFLKKAIPDPTFSESIRHLMDASLPRSLKHIISNADYYGPSLFLLATDVVTVYVFQEPSLLSSLQDKGLTDVVLQALLVKDVPATREVLASLPNMFSALCLNARGLEALILCKPFDRLFKVLLSPDYLPAMRRRRSSDPPGDTASNLGSAMDELMRHQPSLRTETTKAIIKLLEELCSMGRDPRYICQKPQPKAEQVANAGGQSRMGDQAAVSDDDEEDEEEVASMQGGITAKPVELPQATDQGSSNSGQERRPIPLMDYVLNVMKFVEAILSNNTTDDHCREFVTQKGLTPLMGILGLPNLPVDFPTSPSCQAVALVCKAILTLSHEPLVLKQGLLHLNEVLQSLEPLHRFLDPPGGSVLLHELAGVQGMAEPMLSAQAMPLLHALSSAHAYITMFTHVCRVGQSDVRSISVSHWGSDLGLLVLQGLSKLYTSLVWESTVLLAFCSEDILPADCDFGKTDLERLLPKDGKTASTSSSASLVTKLPRPSSVEVLKRSSGDIGSNGVSAAMQSLTTSENSVTAMEVEDPVSTSGDPSMSELSTVLAAKKSKLSPAMQAQIKQIKPLLSASSRLGRALAELFGLLVKLCVGSPVRQRRSQLPQNPVAPTAAARAVATALTKLLANGLSWTPPEYSPVPKLRLTFFICSVGFTSPMLFDEKKFPYHLMLQKFLLSGGQDSLYEAFHWAISFGGKVPIDEGLEHPSLPDGTGEFLDAWLMLLEKMVNTKNVLESPHTLPAKSSQPGFVPFSPLQYLIHTHKMAFTAIMYLWDKKPLKVYGNRMSESILAILCHIIKGEVVIKELLAKERVEEAKAKDATPSSAAGPSGGSASGLTGAIVGTIMSNIHARVNRLSEPELNQEHLQQLMDMGFSREHCSDALRNSASLEQATDWLLTHPPSLPRPAAFPRAAGMDSVVGEDDQMMRAIAISLGENVLVSSDQQASVSSEAKVEEGKKKEETEEEEEEAEVEEQVPEEPLEKSVLDNFTDVMLPGALRLLDELPETVYRVCDLIIVVTNRNGDKWRDNMLVCLVNEIAELCLRLMEAATPLTTSDTMSVSDWANKLSTLPETNKLTVRLHLLSLMFEEMQLPCAETVEDSGILDLLVRLLDSTQRCLSVAVTARPVSTPKWATPLLLLLDLYEKVAVLSKHKADLKEVVGDSHVWKWFDDRSGKWCNYGSSNNKAIDDAYRAGEPSVRFTAGRRRYTVQFGSMIQVNEETANRRPIMLALPTKEERQMKEAVAKQENTDAKERTPSGEEKSSDTQMELGEDVKDESMTQADKDKKRVINGLMPDQISSIVRSGVALIGIPVNPDTLHALMRLLLRLTREYQYAAQFATLGGTKHLLQLKQSSGYQGFTSLATLLFRHVLEEPNTLKHTLEKVVRSATARSGPGLNGVTQGSGGGGLKEMHYVLRVLTPAACRSPTLFSEVTRSILRIALPPPAKRDEDEARLALPSMPQNLKCVSSKQVAVPPMEPHVHEVLCDLLNALTVVVVTREELSTVTAAQSLEDAINQMTRSISDEPPLVRRQGSAADLQQTAEVSSVPFVDDPAPGGSSMTTITPVEEPVKGKEGKEGKGKEDEDKKQQPLLPKSGILRLLAELIKSYAGCALLVTQHTYTAQQSPLITEDCSVLAYMLDNLLPPCQDSGDKDCPALARVVITSLAACNHSPEAQMTLVTEIKSGLQRALALPESTEKHSKVQALTSIISTMIEACPTPGQLPNEVFKGQQNLMNNIVRILLKRGIVTDLARVPHSLDMSSPSMSATINAALKPLETLCRIVNQPQTVSARSAKGKTAPTATAEEDDTTTEATVVEPPTSTAQAVPAGQPGDANTTQQEHDVEVTGTQDTVVDAGEVIIEDVTGNDEAATGLEETMPLEAVEPPHHQAASQHELEAALEHILQRASSQHNTDEVLGEIIMETVDTSRGLEQQGEDGGVVIDVEVETEDMDPHDSQMITQEISEDEGDDVGQDHEENDSEGEEEDEDHEVGDEDDEEGDEDEDEDEDDEEGSDMEADEDDIDFDDFDDDDMPFGMNDDDIEAQLQEMLQTTVAGTQIRSYQLPISIHDTDNNSEMIGPMIPPAPSNVTATHPLLIRQSDSHNVGGAIAARVHRAGRQRGTYRYTGAPGRQTLHVHYTGEQPMPPTPAILQRLLGPSAANVLQLTNTLFSGAQPRFHFIMNDDVHFISRNDDNLFEDLFLDSFFEAEGSNTGMLSNVPAALSRWTEEARVLDADSMHDCITVLKPDIIDELEQHRDKELAERREKRKKLAADEQARREKKNGSMSEVTAALDHIQSAAVTAAVSGAPAESLVWTSNRSARLQGDLNNVDTAGVVTPRLNEGEAVSTDTPTSIPMATPQVLAASSIVTTQSLAEAIATAIVVDALATPIVSSTSTAAGTHTATVSASQSSAMSMTTVTSPLTVTIPSTPHNPLPLVPPTAPPRVTGAMMSAMLDTDMLHRAEAACMRRHMLPPSSNLYPATTTAPSPVVDNSAAIDLSDLSRNRSASALDATSRTVDIGDVVVSMDSVSSLTEADQPNVLATPLNLMTELAMSTPAPRANQAGTSVIGTTAPPGASQTSTTASQVLLAQGLHELVASAASTMSQLLSSNAVAVSSANTTVTTSATTTSGGSEPSVPDGVDPSFLAALPDSIRQEVIAEQLRLQRIRQRAQQQQQQAQSLGITEVNPEFLAALPPSIQEEVLAQQRAEQARLAVQSSTDSADVPVDPAGFIQSLPPSLRQQVLADMDDSMVAVLPPELAAEANVLRHELEERHQRLMQERLFAQPLSAILRQSGAGGRLGPTRYMIRPSHARGTQWGWGTSRIPTTSNANTVRLRGRHLLDHEALTCLMVLLFVDEPRMNTSRLHRVLRNLCYHGPTRTWIIQSLLSILHRTSECKLADTASSGDSISDDKTVDRLKRKTTSSVGADSLKLSGAEMRSTATTLSWLSISLDAALGCRANVFQIHHRGSSANPSGSSKKHSTGAANSYVAVHAQAAPVICRHVLDTLISLARSFPSYFLPQPKTKEVTGGCATEKVDSDQKDKVPHTVKSTASGRPASSSRQAAAAAVTSPPDTDFWDLLLRLDGMSGSKKGKYLLKAHSVGAGNVTSDTDSLVQSFETSPVGQLMNMLAHPVVRRSQLLTDRLLRLLGLVSIGLPDVAQQRQQHVVTSTVTGTVTTQAATTRANTGHEPSDGSVTSVVATGLLGVTTATTTVATTQSNTTVTMSLTGTVCSTTATVVDSSLPTTHQETAASDAATRRQGSGNDGPDADVDEYMTSTPKRPRARQEPSPQRAVLESQLQLAVQVLTSKSCSEEGLEDATNLLLQLSRANSATRDRVLALLLDGATQLGLTVCSHIRTLLQELELMAEKLRETTKEEEPKEDGLGLMLAPKGVMPDRFHGGVVVVHASTKVKSGGRDLQLPSMSTLTSKTSSQHFFLRTLKAIIHLREAARAAAEKLKKQADSRDVTNVSEAMAEAMSYWEAESEAIIERLRHQDQSSASSGVPTPTPPPTTMGAAMDTSGRDLDNVASAADSVTTNVSLVSHGAAHMTDDDDTAERHETPMEMDNPGSSTLSAAQSLAAVGAATEKLRDDKWLLPPLSEQLQLDELWDILSECLTQLSRTPDHHAVLVLQPTVEAFFLVHAGEKADKKKEAHNQRGEDQLAHLNISDTAPLSPAPSTGEGQTGMLTRENSVASVSGATNVPPDTQKFLNFAEKHHVVLNQILRQSTAPLADGPFAVLVDHTRVLDFDVKRRYFRQELEHRDEGIRREDLAVPVRREHVFEDSYRELHRRSAEEWKHRFYIVFEGEEGQDAGGLLREWYLIMSREIFNPMYALFMTSPGDRVTYTINPSSHCNSNHLSYYKFVGRVMAKAIYDNKLLECYFTRSFYKHILGVPVKYTDMESEDYDFYRGLVFLLENTVDDLGYDLTFSTEIREFGVTEVRDIVPNGRNLKVLESRKKEYVKLVCQMKMTGAIRQQLNAFLEGFYDIIPKRLIAIFNEQELELLISGLPTIDIDDLKANTEYHKYQANSLQIQWFWRALRAFDEADRACLLQFVTGTSKVPLQGFAFLEGMTGIQKFQIHRDDRSTDRLPSAHTCFNQLDLPAYETYDKLKKMLLTAIHECSQGFGLA